MGPDTISGDGRGGGGERRLEAMAEHASAGLAVLDATGAFRYTNVAISRLLGYTADSLIGHQAIHLVHPDETTRAVDTLAASRHQPGRTVAIECRLCHLEGYWIDVELSAIDLTTDPSIGGVLVTLTDLTRYRAVSD